MTIEIKLIGQEELAVWDDELFKKEEIRYSFYVLQSGALRVDAKTITGKGENRTSKTTTATVYGPAAWQEVSGDETL
jgi:hypothetical protein